LHLLGGLVGEGHGKNSVGTDPISDEIGDSERNDPRFAGARPGKYQKWTRKGIYCILLRGIEFGHTANVVHPLLRKSPF